MTTWWLILIMSGAGQQVPMSNLSSCLEAKLAYEKRYYRLDASCLNTKTGEVIFKQQNGWVMENNLTERMKKYALAVDGYTPEEHREAAMFADLQATMRALEVAKEALSIIKTGKDKMGLKHDFPSETAEEALKTIDEILGKS